MNSFELNKILGALLGCVLVVLSLNIAAGALFAPEKPAKPGYAIAVKEGGAEKAGPAEPSQPIEVLLASASAAHRASPPSCTLGAKNLTITRISTASSPPER